MYTLQHVIYFHIFCRILNGIDIFAKTVELEDKLILTAPNLAVSVVNRVNETNFEGLGFISLPSATTDDHKGDKVMFINNIATSFDKQKKVFSYSPILFSNENTSVSHLIVSR